jgi:hypothetical protein
VGLRDQTVPACGPALVAKSTALRPAALGLFAVPVVLIGALGLRVRPESDGATWLAVLGAFALVALVLGGRAVSGRRSGGLVYCMLPIWVLAAGPVAFSGQIALAFVFGLSVGVYILGLSSGESAP